jgi:hypothetical protein
VKVLAIAYAIVLTFAVLDSVFHAIGRRDPLFRIILQSIAGLGLLAAFATYLWPINNRIGNFAVAGFFTFSVFWYVASIPRDFRNVSLKDATAEENYSYNKFVVVVGSLLDLPAFWFGGISVCRTILGS